MGTFQDNNGELRWWPTRLSAVGLAESRITHEFMHPLTRAESIARPVEPDTMRRGGSSRDDDR